MPAIRRVTLTYTESIQLAPYNTVNTGLVVEVEPDIEDGPDAVRDLAGLIESTWSIVGPATHRQVRAAVEEFEALQGERRQRATTGDAPLRAPAGNGNGATHTPVEPSPATDRQREAIAGLRASLNWSDAGLAAFAQQLGVDIATLNRGEASALLTALQSQPRKRASPPPAADDGGFPARTTESAEEPREPASPPAPPRTPEEAEQRFYTRYGAAIGGETIADVRRFLGKPRLARPTTIEAWVALAEEVRDRLRAAESPSS